MKIFRVVGIALLAVLFSGSFTSCGKDDPQYELIREGKKVVKVEIEDPYTNAVNRFIYDGQGRLKEVICESDSDNRDFKYIWGSNQINSSGDIFHLKDGFISKLNGYSEVTYNSNKQPIEVGGKSDYSSYSTFVWGTNRLQRMSSYQRNQNIAMIQNALYFEYYEPFVTCNGYNPIIPILLSKEFYNNYLCVAHPELVNARTTILPTSFKIEEFYLNDSGRLDYDTYKGNISYKFDNDGYLTQCIMRKYAHNDIEETKYTITWE